LVDEIGGANCCRCIIGKIFIPPPPTPTPTPNSFAIANRNIDIVAFAFWFAGSIALGDVRVSEREPGPGK